MSIVKFMTSKGGLLNGPSRCFEILPSVAYQVLPTHQTESLTKQCSFKGEFIRHLYTTKIVRDMEASVKAISGGVAATGVIGPGIGIGIIFGNAIIGCARNPSVANKLLNLALMGAAFCESLGLLAIVISFLTIL